MKKTFIIPLLVSALFFSCRKESVQTITRDDQLTAMQDKPYTVNPGSIVFSKCDDWKITYYKKGKDILTDQFGHMNFNFCPNNRVFFYNDLFTVPGTWYFFSSKNGWVFTLSFSGEPQESFSVSPHVFLADIEGQWLLIKIQGDLLRLGSEDGMKVMMLQRSSVIN